jgi:hypothetical protein
VCLEARVKFKNIDFRTEADFACYSTLRPSKSLTEFLEEPRLGLWDRHSILQEFLLWNKWDIPDFTSDEEDLETFEMEKQNVAKQIQRLQVKYPDKKFPEIRWRFIQFESEYF